MGISLFGKNKKKQTDEFSEKDPNELSDPGLPTADSVDLVGVVGIEPPFLLTKEGAFLLMLEIPEIEMDITGHTEMELYERFQMALAALPPGTKFQMTMMEEPVDALEDLQYFYDKAEYFKDDIELKDPSSHEYRQGAALAASSLSMMASVADWFDRVRPIRRRTIISLYYLPGAGNVARNIVMGQYAALDVDLIRKNKDKAIENISERLSILQNAFAGAGLPLEILSPAEMCRVVWRSMHPISSNDPELKATDLAIAMAQKKNLSRKIPPDPEAFYPDISQEELANLLAPDNVIERKDTLEIDGVLMIGYVIHDFRANRPTFLYRLNELDGGWIGTMFVEVMDPAVAADRLSQRETQLSAQEMVKAKQGMLMDFGVRQEVRAVQESRMELETIGQAPINIRFFVFRTALTGKELTDRCRDLESLFKTIGVASFPAQYTQKQLWRSYIPLGVLCTEQKKRNMNAPSLSTFFWPQRKRYNEPDGIYMGIDDSTSLPLFMDPFGKGMNKTPTFLSIGRPGAGKTVWLRTMMTSAMISGGRVLAVDIEGELEEYCNYYGGKYIEVGRKNGELINVLDVPVDTDDEDNDVLGAGTEHLISFCEAVRGASIPQGPEWNALADAYKATMIDRDFIKENNDHTISVKSSNWNREDAPRLSDVADILGRSPDPVWQSLYQMLLPYVQGVYANYFNKATTFNIRDEKLVIFGLKTVNTHSSSNQLRVYLWQILGLIWSEVLSRYAGDKTTANNVMLDEVWALLKAPGGASAIENMARRFRKRRAGLWLATQEVGEFLDSPDAKKILSIVGNTFLMDQRPTEARLLQNIYSLSDDMTAHLTRLGTGKGIMMLPEKTLRVSVAVPKEWHSY